MGRRCRAPRSCRPASPSWYGVRLLSSAPRFDFDTGRLLKVLDKTLAAMQTPAEPGERARSGRPVGEPPAARRADRPSAERAGPSEPPAPPPPTTEPPRATRRRRGLLIAGGAAALIAAVLAIAVVFGGGDDGGAGPGVPNTIPLEPRAGPDGMAIDGDVMWVTDQAQDVLWRVDVERNKRIDGPIDDIRLVNPDGVAAKDGTVWVANSDFVSMVTRLQVRDDGTVSPKKNIVIEPKGSTRPEALALGSRWLWVTTNSGHLARIDPVSATPGPPIPIGKGTV